jgi:hypothetical protein
LFKQQSSRIAHRIELALDGSRNAKCGREPTPTSVNAPCEGIHSAALDPPSKTGHAFEAIRQPLPGSVHERQGEHTLTLDQRMGGERFREHRHEAVRFPATRGPLNRANAHG